MAGMETIAIIGGGASGLMAAVEASLALRQAGAVAHVALFEADPERTGRSILATGNGRCNISNACISADAYRNQAFVEQALMHLQRAYVAERGKTSMRTLEANPALERFADMGLVTREESEGRLYPMANKATSVLDVLRSTAAELGVDVQTDKRALRVDAPAPDGAGCFNIRFADKTIAHAAAVIVAIGGCAASGIELPKPLICSDMQPVLGPLRVDAQSAKLTRQLNNIRVRGTVHLERGGQRIASERGELLFRDYGVSGVSVFNLSRFAQPGDDLVVDFLPDIPPQDMERFMMTRVARGCRSCWAVRLRSIASLRACCCLRCPSLPSAKAGLRTGDRFTQEMVPQLCNMLKGMRLTVEGIGDERQCQVRRGGFPVERFSPATCEALDVPGLFVTGEALDIDAPCGGFNLHWAWSSGMLAGRAAADCVARGEEVSSGKAHKQRSGAPADAKSRPSDKRSPDCTGSIRPSSDNGSRSQGAMRSGCSQTLACADGARSLRVATPARKSRRGRATRKHLPAAVVPALLSVQASRSARVTPIGTNAANPATNAVGTPLVMPVIVIDSSEETMLEISNLALPLDAGLEGKQAEKLVRAPRPERSTSRRAI